jgi:hypothetical protein
VEFYYDGSYLAGTATASPYSVPCNTATMANGSHSFTAKAYDAAGNSTVSTAVTATVSNADTTPPSVSLAAPANGSTVSGTITLSANASDNVGVTKVEFYRDGALLGTDTATPYTLSDNTTTVPNGSHSYTAKAYDAAGNSTVSAASTVTVNNADTTPPTVSLTAPANSSTVSGTITLSATASDNVGVTKVEFYRDGTTLVGTATISPYSVTDNTTAVANGSHSYTAKAYDAAGNSTVSAASTVTVNNADTTPPTVSLTAPANGSTISGTITLSANASDNVGVTKVEFYRDGTTLVGTATISPYSVTDNTTGLANGSHSYTAKAYDAAGNSTVSAASTVTVNNADTTPPTVSLTAPANGSTVSGTITLSATASDNVGVSKVEFYRDGTLVATDTSAPYTASDNTTSLVNGSHTYTAKAYDAAGNATTSAASTVTVSNDTTPPTVSLTAPANGSTVSGTITLSATASDNVGVTKVEFYRDGALIGTVTASPYNLSDNTTSVPNGSHTYMAKGYDAAGNSSTSSSTVTVSNSTGGTPGQLQWVETMLTSRASVTAQCNGVAADASGNVIGVGTFNDTVNFGSTTIPYTSMNSSAFVAQYATSGALKWLITFGKTGNAGATAVAIDSKNNIIVVGSFSSSVDFGGQILTAYDPNATGALDMFVAKYSQTGSLLWAKAFGGGQSDQANGVAVGTNDDVFITGYIGIGNATFGTTTVTGAGMQNLAVARITSAGAVTWARSWGNSTVTASSLAVDKGNDVAVTGQFSGSTDIGGGTMAATGNYTVFVAKYSGVDGSCRWAKGFGGSGYNAGCGITTDPTTANIVVTGGYTGSANFGGGPTSASAGEAAFLAGYDPSGNYLWAKTFGGNFGGEISEGRAVSMDAHGNLAWAGHMGTSSWFVNGQTIVGGPYFASDWTVSGNVAPALRWFTPQVYSATSADCNAKAVALDNFGHVLASGSFYSGIVNLGSLSITTPAGGTSGFLSEYSN